MSDALNALNCTTCGSPLPALAGHKAKALVCSYCGSVMDRHDGYKVLAQYRDMPRPDGPFQLGDAGEVLGVPQTIVGIVGVESRIEGVMYRWTNYQLYSPTHGYSWMTWNDGHLTHSRKVRDGTDHQQSNFYPRGEFSAMGRPFKMFESYDAVIHYIEGELTWVPKLGDRVKVIDGIAPPHGFSLAIADEEIETEYQTYLNRKEVLESFGFADDLPSASGVHAIQPFEPGELHSASAKAAKLFLPIAGVAALLLTFIGGGSTIASTRIADMSKGGEVTFEAPSTSRLMSIELKAPLRNQWSWYDMTLVHKESGEEVEFGSGLQYYSGRSGGESWSEGSQSATMRFKPPQVGEYTLRIANAPLDQNTSTIDRQQFGAKVPLSVEVRQNVYVARYFWILTILAAVIFGSMWLRERMFETARWGGGDDDDD